MTVIYTHGLQDVCVCVGGGGIPHFLVLTSSPVATSFLCGDISHLIPLVGLSCTLFNLFHYYKGVVLSQAHNWHKARIFDVFCVHASATNLFCFCVMWVCVSTRVCLCFASVVLLALVVRADSTFLKYLYQLNSVLEWCYRCCWWLYVGEEGEETVL